MLQVRDQEAWDAAFCSSKRENHVQWRRPRGVRPVERNRLDDGALSVLNSTDFKNSIETMKQSIFDETKKEEHNISMLLEYFLATKSEVLNDVDDFFGSRKEDRAKRREALFFGRRYKKTNASKTRLMVPQVSWSQLHINDSVHCHFQKPNRNEAYKNKKIVGSLEPFFVEECKTVPRRKTCIRTDFAFLLKERY